MSDEEDRLLAILAVIIEVYDAPDPEHRRPLLHLNSFSGPHFTPWAEGGPVVTRDEIDALADEGWIDVDYTGKGQPLVRPERAGRDVLRTLRRERSLLARSERVDLSWDAVRPVLHAVVSQFEEHGASGFGYLNVAVVAETVGCDPGDYGLIRRLERLADRDWIALRYDEDDETPRVKPTQAGIEATRGWPSGDGEVMAENLLTALDEIIETSSDAEKRNWAKRTKETAMDLGQGALAELLKAGFGGVL